MMEFTNEEIRALLQGDTFTDSERESALYAQAVADNQALEDVR